MLLSASLITEPSMTDIPMPPDVPLGSQIGGSTSDHRAGDVSYSPTVADATVADDSIVLGKLQTTTFSEDDDDAEDDDAEERLGGSDDTADPILCARIARTPSCR